jgi:hypothetical protein
MAAGRILISGWKAADLELRPIAAKVELRKLAIATRTTKAHLIEGESEAARGTALAEKLHQEGII